MYTLCNQKYQKKKLKQTALQFYSKLLLHN